MQSATRVGIPGSHVHHLDHEGAFEHAYLMAPEAEEARSECEGVVRWLVEARKANKKWP